MNLGLVDVHKELCIGGRLNKPVVGIYKTKNDGYEYIKREGGGPFPFIGYKDTCQGDSGGPQWILDENERAVLVGIVSRGGECAAKDSPGVSTRHSLSYSVHNFSPCNDTVVKMMIHINDKQRS